MTVHTGAQRSHLFPPKRKKTKTKRKLKESSLVDSVPVQLGTGRVSLIWTAWARKVSGFWNNCIHIMRNASSCSFQVVSAGLWHFSTMSAQVQSRDGAYSQYLHCMWERAQDLPVFTIQKTSLGQKCLDFWIVRIRGILPVGVWSAHLEHSLKPGALSRIMSELGYFLERLTRKTLVRIIPNHSVSSIQTVANKPPLFGLLP